MLCFFLPILSKKTTIATVAKNDFVHVFELNFGTAAAVDVSDKYFRKKKLKAFDASFSSDGTKIAVIHDTFDGVGIFDVKRPTQSQK